MSWISVARAVFKSRYELTSSWYQAAKTIDTYAFGPVQEARGWEYLYPGSVINQPTGYFRTQRTGAMPTFNGNNQPGSVVYEGFMFRTLPPDLGADNLLITKSMMGDPDSWVQKDWTLDQLVSIGADAAYAQLLRDYVAMIDKLWSKVTWLPREVLPKIKYLVFNVGMTPVILSASDMADPNNFGIYLPRWLNTPERQAAWNDFASDFQVMTTKLNQANLAAARKTALLVQANTAKWERIAKWSGADFIAQKWAALSNAIRSLNQSATQVGDSAKRVGAMLASTPGAFTSAQKQKLNQLVNQQENIRSEAKKSLSGPLMEALVGEGQGIAGLGIAPVVIIAIGVTTIAAATTTILGYAKIMETTRREIFQLEAEMLKQQTAFNQEQLSQVTGSIEQRRQQLRELFDQGLMTQQNYDHQMKQLAQEQQMASSQFLSTQKLNQDMASQFNQDAKKASQSSVVALMSQFKWMGLAAAAIIGTIYIAPRVAKKK